MRLLVSPLILGFCCLSLPLQAQNLAGAMAENVSSECLAVEQAFMHNRVAELRSLQLSTPRWQAQRFFRLAAALIPADEHKAARSAVLEGLSVVNTALRQNPEDVELLLLGAVLDGQILLLSPWRFFHNGRRGLKRLRQAEMLEPENPRAVMVRGTAQVLLPAILGGKRKTGRTSLHWRPG